MPRYFPSWSVKVLRGAFVLLALAGSLAWSHDLVWDDWCRTQGDVYTALLARGVADKDRALLHLAHTCNLVGTGGVFHVVEIRELVRGGPSPRGVNYLIIMSDDLQVVAKVELGPARPYYCESNQVVLDGEVDVPGLNKAGNALILDDGGHVVAVRRLDAADMAGFRPQRLGSH